MITIIFSNYDIHLDEHSHLWYTAYRVHSFKFTIGGSLDSVTDIAQNLRGELKALSPRPLPVTVLGVLKKYDLNSPIVATEVIRLAGLIRKDTGWYFEDEIQERIEAEGEKDV